MEKIKLATPEPEVHLLTAAQQMGLMNRALKDTTEQNEMKQKIIMRKELLSAGSHFAVRSALLLGPCERSSSSSALRKQVWSCLYISEPYCERSKSPPTLKTSSPASPT